ncbi:hypothetical protein BDA99DRAFT_607571 [Phascolomyces articulosus]|uniref:CCHC-type domain-containing protein n=1 Tax=Phascolomyces articulosus TaxID=60185 RepID=A0AAD5JT75_9FUNG|nr:hypothetical protein BDA99DRAFT_607571 [Phascolomyces articulosus]
MDNSIEALKVEQSAISKELARFRPCHPESRCYFCREWAQFVYKKHVASIQKTQDNQDQAMVLKAGRYSLRLPNDTSTAAATNVDHKGQARQMFKTIKQKLKDQDENSNTTGTTTTTLAEEIIAACNAWIESPSNVTTLNSLFEPVQFDPYDQGLFEEEQADPKEPGRLLNPLIVKRQHVLLPSKEFKLLKNLTGDVLLSHREAMCDHIRPEWKSPNDLDVDRAIFNEKMDQEIKKELGRLEQVLNISWQHLTEFMIQLRAIDKDRIRLLGKEECQKDIDYFAGKQSDLAASFQEYWSPFAANFKKKQRNGPDLATVDAAFNEYFDYLVGKAEQFQKEFVLPRLEAVVGLLKKLWELLMPTIRQMAERMATFECKNEKGENIGERMKANCAKLVKSVESVDPMTDVKKATESIQQETEARIKEYVAEIEELKKVYMEGKASVTMRLDKIANHKAFKKQIKKAEGGYHSIRQHFRYQLTQKIFPETRFAKFCLVSVEALIQEGELMEVMTIEREMKRFSEEQKDMVEERQYLFEDFEDGIMTGRRELAGIMGRLFLKEGMRIQGENLALQRQYTLLQSLGDKGATPSPSGRNTFNEPQPSVSKQELSSGVAGKKKKTRTKKGAANTTSDNSLSDAKKDVQLVSDRLELLNKLCDSVLDDDEEKKKDEKPAIEFSTSNKGTGSKPASGASSSAPKLMPKQQEQKNMGTTPKSSTTPKTVSPAPSTSVSSKPASPRPTSPAPVATAVQSSTTTITTVPTPSPKRHTPSPPPKEKVVESKSEPKKATTPTAVKLMTPPPSQIQQQEPSKSTSTTLSSKSSTMPSSAEPVSATSTTSPSQDLGGWGSVNAAEMVKGWHALKDSVPVREEVKQQQQPAKKKVAESPPQDDGWDAAPPVPKRDIQADAWAAENTEAWKKNHEKIRQMVDATSMDDVPKPYESNNKPTTTSDGWTEIPTKKKQLSPVAQDDGWNQVPVSSSSPSTEKQPTLGGWGATTTTTAAVTANDDGWGASQVNKTTTMSDGWESQESKKATAVNDSWGAVDENKTPANDGWGAKEEKVESASGDRWGAASKQTANDGWDSIPKQTSNDGWRSQEKKSANDEWSAQEKKTSKTNNRWSTLSKETKAAANNGWGSSSNEAANDNCGSTPKKLVNDGWGAQQETKSTADDGWGTTSKQSVSSPSNDGWGVSANDGWSKEGTNGWDEKKTSNHRQSSSSSSSYSNNRNRSQQQQQQKSVDKWNSAGNAGWGNSTGWNNQEEKENLQSRSSVPDNGWDNDNSKQQWQQQQQMVKPINTTATITPPGMSAPGTPLQQHSDSEVVNFSLKDILQQTPAVPMQPPGLTSTAMATPPPTATTSSTISPPMNKTLGSAGGILDTTMTSALSSSLMQQQEPVPAEQMRTMSHDTLITFVQTIQRDNSRLLQSLIAAQQEMTMQTSRYSELMTLSRERETQLLQLFEARKQTEMEEARRYILSLEARISTLETQLKSANNAAAAAAAAAANNNNGGGDVGGITAGFGNQDLFAGYRESMRSNNHSTRGGGRRYYNKQPPIIRCGNCGGSGHTSAECQDVCRYCGSHEHLSESCSGN